MSADPIVFGVCFPIDLALLAAGVYWNYKDAKLTHPDASLRRLRRWIVIVTLCVVLWQIFIFWPWQKGQPATHIPSEIALACMLMFGYWVGYLWIGDWCSYYFAKFHTPFPNKVYNAFGVASVLAGLFAGLRSIVPFLLDDLWVYDLFFLFYMVPLVFGMACCVKLAWDVRSLTKQRYIQVLSSANEDEQPLIASSRRTHMCKVNFLIVYFTLGFLSLAYWVPVFISNLSTMKPGTPIHTRPEVPIGLVVATTLSFWIPYAILLWYTKFEWQKDPLDIGAGGHQGTIGLDTMTKV